jgi:hypothetical protein
VLLLSDWTCGVLACLERGADGSCVRAVEEFEYEKGVQWMPWHQEAMKDVARCEKPRGDASDR